MAEKARILEHLENDYGEAVRDPVWKNIPISRPLLRIAELAPFQKLEGIRQLGPAYLVYPGATHTRRSHSLGVFHVARRMITSLVRRSPAPVGAGPGAAPLTLEGVKAFLCAALLHDIGHFPFAHSLKDLQVSAHESLAADQVLLEFASVIREHLMVDPRIVAEIIDCGRPCLTGCRDVPLYRTILSGALDPDKLDYLNRDAYFCGVPYGVQDVDFILEELYPHPRTGVAVSPKGITALENILFSKYLMYKTVYWHKTVRIATAMIKKAIAMGLAAGDIRREDLYGLDDAGFFATFTEERSPSFHLISEVRRRSLYKLVWRARFLDEASGHRRLESITERLAIEERIASDASSLAGRRIPPDNIVVDVPERIGFDVDIPVVDVRNGELVDSPAGSEGAASPNGPTGINASLFARMGSEDLPRSLRTISVAVCRDEDALAALARMDFSRYFPPI